MSVPGTGDTADDDVRRLEEWFDDNGLPYFVAGRTEVLEAWLGNVRILFALLVVLVLSVAAGLGVTALSESASLGTLAGVVLCVLVVGGYAGGLLRMAAVARWAVRRTFGSLGLLLPLATRALPLLLLFVTFLFINAEVWQVASGLPRASLWSIVLLFGAVATAFLLVRLPEEVDAAAAEVDHDRVRETCGGTPAEPLLARIGPVDAAARLPRLARVNLVLVLLFSQALQVLVLSVAVLVFLVVFGSLAIGDGVVESWVQREPRSLTLFGGVDVPLVSNDLFQVGLFLAAFSGLYFTVYAVTDATYREQFFAGLSREIEQAVALHAVYRAALTPARG